MLWSYSRSWQEWNWATSNRATRIEWAQEGQECHSDHIRLWLPDPWVGQARLFWWGSLWIHPRWLRETKAVSRKSKTPETHQVRASESTILNNMSRTGSSFNHTATWGLERRILSEMKWPSLNMVRISNPNPSLKNEILIRLFKSWGRGWPGQKRVWERKRSKMRRRRWSWGWCRHRLRRGWKRWASSFRIKQKEHSKMATYSWSSKLTW